MIIKTMGSLTEPLISVDHAAHGSREQIISSCILRSLIRDPNASHNISMQLLGLFTAYETLSVFCFCFFFVFVAIILYDI